MQTSRFIVFTFSSLFDFCLDTGMQAFCLLSFVFFLLFFAFYLLPFAFSL